jgi:hypothetical protein
MKSIQRFWLILIPTVALGAVVYYYRTPTPQPAHAAIARDRSDSVQSTCKCSEFLLKEAMRAPGMGKESTLTLIGSGDETSADEPVLIATSKLPVSRIVTEGKKATDRQQEALVSEFGKKCGAMPVTKR